VGIYNRWLKTAGGGEKYTGAIAEVLSRQHLVEFITHERVDLRGIAAFLTLDLKRVSVRIVPDSAHDVARARADYDLLINASHLDYIASRARRNALVVYFPASTVGEAIALGRYNRVTSVVRRIARALVWPPLRRYLRRLLFTSPAQSSDQTLTGRLALKLFQTFAAPVPQNSLLHGYDAILVISKYTQRWVQKYWGRGSYVLYPRIQQSVDDGTAKRHSILTVGRFFAGNHNKKHVAMIQAFQRVRQFLPDWELHLAGGYSPTASNAMYLKLVEATALGVSGVHLHVNCGAEELATLYRQSKLYWHATGFEESELEHPERFEHFGITTVEAMAAGCVPLVLGAGGLPEIVCSDVDGIVWNDLETLCRESVALGHDDQRWCRLSRAARLRALDFDSEAFDSRLDLALGLLEVSSASD